MKSIFNFICVLGVSATMAASVSANGSDIRPQKSENILWRIPSEGFATEGKEYKIYCMTNQNPYKEALPASKVMNICFGEYGRASLEVAPIGFAFATRNGSTEKLQISQPSPWIFVEKGLGIETLFKRSFVLTNAQGLQSTLIEEFYYSPGDSHNISHFYSIGLSGELPGGIPVRMKNAPHVYW